MQIQIFARDPGAYSGPCQTFKTYHLRKWLTTSQTAIDARLKTVVLFKSFCNTEKRS